MIPGDLSAFVRDPSAIQAEGNPAAGSPGTAVQPAPRETFAVLDADPAIGAPALTHAGPRQAEAGFKDPDLGWVGVRAGLSGGGVHAALVPGSTQAAQELGRHMDGLNAYLTEQNTPVDSLVVDAPNHKGAASTADQGLRPGMGQGMGQGMDQGAHPGAGRDSRGQAYEEPASSPSLASPGFEGPAVAQTPATTVEPRSSAQGVHISVVA